MKTEESQDISFSYSKTDKETKVKVAGLNSSNLKIILTFLTVIILGIAGMIIFSDGCSSPIPPTPPPPPVDTINIETPPPPTALGPTGSELGYEESDPEYELADFLSDSEQSLPSKVIKIIEAKFSKNSARLKSSSYNQLNNIVDVLEEYPDARVEIYGYMEENETGNGNKELGLDDQRARSIYNYLKRKGIDESRMDFQGDGIDENFKAGIRIYSR